MKPIFFQLIFSGTTIEQGKHTLYKLVVDMCQLDCVDIGAQLGHTELEMVTDNLDIGKF